MKHIFYLITMLIAIKELMWIVNPKKGVYKRKRTHVFLKQMKGKKYEDHNNDELGKLIVFGIRSYGIILWLLAGLFTFNWIAFLAEIIYVLFVSRILKANMYNKFYTVLSWINSVIGFGFCLFVMINSYHLKIDLYELIKSYLK